MSEPTVMELHATELGGLKPVNIVQAARQDLKNRAYNTRKPRPDEYRHYAFHRRHVAKAETIEELIEIALKDAKNKLPEEPTEEEADQPGPLGINSGKKWTRIIYRDVSTLEDAMVLAKETS